MVPAEFSGDYHFYNDLRNYDPTLGRYVQSDPIGLQGGINTYAYVANRPVTASDPEGTAGAAAGALPALTGGGGDALAALLADVPPVAAVIGAGAVGVGIGNYAYNNGLAGPIGNGIDHIVQACSKVDPDKCYAAYEFQVQNVCNRMTTKRGRQLCYAQASEVLAECLTGKNP
jgi:RHS repeat-associated protein